MPLLPTIHRPYYDYDLFFIYKPLNQQLGVRPSGRGGWLEGRPGDIISSPGDDLPTVTDHYTRMHRTGGGLR